MFKADSGFDGKILWALGLVILFWSSAFAGIRAALSSYSPGHLAVLRFLFASGILLLYAPIARIRRPEVKDIPTILLHGFLGITFYHLALNYGEVTVTAGCAGFLIASIPLFCVLLSSCALKEKVPNRAKLGILTGFFGVYLLSGGDGSSLFAPGAPLILAGCLAAAIYLVYQKPLLRRYSALEYTSYIIWAGTLFMLPFLSGLTDTVKNAPISTTLSVAYLGIFPGAVAYILYAYAISRMSMTKATAVQYLNPFVSLIIAWIWLGEIPTTIMLAGGVTSIAGVFLISTSK